MNKNLNDIYYILRQDCSFDDFSVDSTESESHVDYDYDEIICGSNPVHFKLEMEDLGDLVEEHIFLYDGPSFLVNTKLKEIINYGLYQCQFYPAIIIDEIGNTRKDFWVLNTFGMLDALDDKESNISSSDDDSSVVGLIIKNRVLRYSLDEKKLSLIPEQERLMFKLENTSIQPIFVHQSLVDIFKVNNVKGVKFFKVSEYEFGDEF